jgi:hypothetical protein
MASLICRKQNQLIDFYMQRLNNACTRYAFSGKYAPDYYLEKIKRREISGKSGYLANSKWESVHHNPPPK